MKRPLALLALAPLAFAALTEGAAAADPVPVAEIVTFRLVPGADPQDFTRAARALDPFLRDTGAVMGRTLSRDARGLWTDHVIWRSMHEAEAAAAELMQRPEAQPFLAMIEPDGMVMRHAPVMLQME